MDNFGVKRGRDRRTVISLLIVPAEEVSVASTAASGGKKHERLCS